MHCDIQRYFLNLFLEQLPSLHTTYDCAVTSVLMILVEGNALIRSGR